MDTLDSETAVDLINDYWPGTLEQSQVQSWARLVRQTGADFDTACQWIADHAATNPYPPRLNELCTAIRPRPEPLPVEDTGPPVDRTRGQAWAAHVFGIGQMVGARITSHDHRNGWERCTVCSNPNPPQQCGNATCPICAA